MSQLIQTFLSYKALKDATGKQYVVFISHGSNPIVRISTSSKGLILTRKTQSTLRDGNVEHIYTYTGLGTVNIEFKGRETTQIDIGEFQAGQEIGVPFDSLERSFSFDISTESEKGYDISDALFYQAGTVKYKQTFILPQSTNPHLDTSSRTDFYYTTDGTTAYIASTSLQNSFLNNIRYTNRGSTARDLGKFRGGQDDGSELRFTNSYEAPNAGVAPGPFVAGGIKVISLPARTSFGPNENRVCLDPQATNYYLTGCVDETLPCVDSGVTHANDCLGVALTSNRLNNFLNIDGGCCEYSTGCEDFNVTLGTGTQESPGQANAEISVTVSGGTQNYTAVVNAVELLDSSASFSTQTTNNIATDTFTISSLIAGEYTLTVTDSTSGTACSQTVSFSIELKGDAGNEGEGAFGCKSVSTAINHDTTVTTHQARLCVFCDQVSGLLFSNTSNPTFLADAFVPTDVNNPFNSSNATSTPEGVSVADGTLTFLGVNLLNQDIVLSQAPSLHTFNPAEEFTTDQANMFNYQLYRIDSEVDGFMAEVNAGPNGNAKGWLTANATAIGSLVESDGSSHTFTGLGPGNYTVLISYDSDGTLDNNPDEEKCYSVTIPFKVLQIGCTDQLATNYNVDFTSIPQLFGRSEGCEYNVNPPDGNLNCESPGIVFKPNLVCINYYANQDLNGIYLNSDFWGEDNPLLDDIGNNGFTVTQQNHPYFSPGDFYQDTANNGGNITINYRNNLNQYFWAELFCYDVFNADIDPSLHINGVPAPQSIGGTDTLGNTDPGDLSKLRLLKLVVQHEYSDGTTAIISPEGGIEFSAFSVAGWYSYMGLGNPLKCEVLADHGLPVSITTSFNYGEFGVWDQVYSYTHTYTEDELNIFETCCEDVFIEEPEIEGCTDPAADNYNNEATIDDGSCDYPEPPDVPGCTDEVAENFDPEATIDDGSCQYVQQGSWKQVNCYECEYYENHIDGYNSQEQCEAAISQESDCCIIGIEGLNLNPPTWSGTETGSTFNSETGLCEEDCTGQFTISLPTLDTLIAQTTNLSYIWTVWNSATETYYSNIFGGDASAGYTFEQYEEALVNLTTGDLIAAPSGIFQEAATLTNLCSGAYHIQIQFIDVAAESGGTTHIGLPIGTTPFCHYINVIAVIGIHDCEPTVVHGCTDEEALNYLKNCAGADAPDATVDDGCCEYEDVEEPEQCLCLDGSFSEECCTDDESDICGCMDPNASNFNANATFYNPRQCPCEYEGDGEDPPTTTSVLSCVPRNLDQTIEYNSNCIAKAGHRFYTKHITGLGNNCSNMETMKMVIINDLLSRKGLPCIFNCTDNETPSPEEASNDCAKNWEDSGSLYWNPRAAREGQYKQGVYVKRDGFIYFAAGSGTSLMFDPLSKSKKSGWKRCKTISILGETEKYLPNFLKFAYEYCKDCGIPPYRTESTSSSSVTDTFSTGGSNITIDGASFDNISDQSALSDGEDRRSSNEDLTGESGGYSDS